MTGMYEKMVTRIISVDTPINPRYVEHWFGVVSVGDAINNAFKRIFDRALRLATRYGEATVIVPTSWKDCSKNMVAFLNVKLQMLEMIAYQAGMQYNCTIHIGTERRTHKYVELQQCVFHLNKFEKNVGDIPTHWRSGGGGYTWTQVCANGQYYSSSSSEIWPPPAYVRLSQLEKIRAARLKQLLV